MEVVHLLCGEGKALWKHMYWDLPYVSPIWGKRVPAGSRASKVVIGGLSRGKGTIGSNKGAWLTKSAVATVVGLSRLLGCSRSHPVRLSSFIGGAGAGAAGKK
jgi:hypothetical protein